MKELSKVALGVALFALVVGFYLPRPTGIEKIETIVKEVGSVSSNAAHQFFGDSFTIGGTNLATTTGVTLTSYTLTAQEEQNHTVKINPSVDLTLKISATSSGSLVPNVGDEYSFLLQNSSTTAASSLTLDNADASVDIQLAEATGADLVLAGLNWAKVTVVRNAFTGTKHITVFVSEFVPG